MQSCHCQRKNTTGKFPGATNAAQLPKFVTLEGKLKKSLGLQRLALVKITDLLSCFFVNLRQSPTSRLIKRMVLNWHFRSWKSAFSLFLVRHCHIQTALSQTSGRGPRHHVPYIVGINVKTTFAILEKSKAYSPSPTIEAPPNPHKALELIKGHYLFSFPKPSRPLCIISSFPPWAQ